MQAKAVAIAAAVGIAALSGWSLPASAAECFRGTVTGPNGPAVMKGCMVRQPYAIRAPRRAVTTTTTRTVTHNYYVTTSRPYTTTVTRDYYYSVPVREWDEDVYYGSSYPEPRYYEPQRYYGPPRFYEPRHYEPMGY